MRKLKEIIETPLSDGDLENFLGKDVHNNILTYADLADYQDLEQLLPHHKSYKIILIEYEQNSGHWICMLRYGQTIEIFNSFGTKHDKDDFVKSKEINKFLGQSALYLNELLEKEINDDMFQLIYNKRRFQKKSVHINTCGRHVVNRIICLLHYDMTLKEYIKFMDTAERQTKYNDDEIVSILISLKNP
jgi:hypothetical protein